MLLMFLRGDQALVGEDLQIPQAGLDIPAVVCFLRHDVPAQSASSIEFINSGAPNGF